jgi:uncharacterized membrane protein YcfT
MRTGLIRTAPDTRAPRVAWIDHAKGISIVLVVMMHSVLGVEEAMGTATSLGAVVEWAQPFRMPAFFLLAGLFLSRSIAAPWRSYLDGKVLHFVYFYLLWVAIQVLLKVALFAGGGPAEVARAFALALVQPYGTLWFIYLLPVFFVVAKATRHAPVLLILIPALGLQALHLQTGSVLLDEFAARFAFFYMGYVFADQVFGLARLAGRHPRHTLGWLAAWLAVSVLAMLLPGREGASFAALPGVALLLGVAGAAAMVALSALLARGAGLPPLRWLGSQSLVVYLGFFLPMAITRMVLIKLGVGDATLVSLAVIASALAGPLVAHAVLRTTPLRLLFERPAALHLGPALRLRPAG